MSREVSLKCTKLVKYILNNSAIKIPSRRIEMVNAVSISRKDFLVYFSEAQQVLQEVFGLKLVQIPEKIPQYICVSTLKPVSELEYTDAHRRNITLLYLILSFIFMKAGFVNEENLHQYLKKLGIPVDEVHEYFGNVKKKLTETYVKQQYLRRERRVIDGANEEILYHWGARSTVEFSTEKVVSLVSELLEKPASCFMNQYNIANEEMSE